MNAPPPNFAASPFGSPHAVLERQWRALHEAAAAVAALAGRGPRSVSPDPVPFELRGFPSQVGMLVGARRQLVEEGLADLVAIMEPGLTALLCVHERKADTTVPAQALWQEFMSARGALVALAQDRGI
jgi:hypothetical protein